VTVSLKWGPYRECARIGIECSFGGCLYAVCVRSWGAEFRDSRAQAVGLEFLWSGLAGVWVDGGCGL